MIIAVTGIEKTPLNYKDSGEYKREFYQLPLTKNRLKEKVKKDFGEFIENEMSRLKINILV